MKDKFVYFTTKSSIFYFCLKFCILKNKILIFVSRYMFWDVTNPYQMIFYKLEVILMEKIQYGCRYFFIDKKCVMGFTLWDLICWISDIYVNRLIFCTLGSWNILISHVTLTSSTSFKSYGPWKLREEKCWICYKMAVYFFRISGWVIYIIIKYLSINVSYKLSHTKNIALYHLTATLMTKITNLCPFVTANLKKTAKIG